MMLRAFLHFPFSRPGYEWNAWPEDSGALAIDFYSCPMRDYLKSQGEEEFMRNSIFALAQAMATGGRYERAHTLSAGDPVCDMRWFAGKPAPADPRYARADWSTSIAAGSGAGPDQRLNAVSSFLRRLRRVDSSRAVSRLADRLAGQ